MYGTSAGDSASRYAHLDYLRPQWLRLGSVGVFAGDWAITDGRIGEAFVGILVDWWNGAAVWSCTRQVAEAVVADQQRMQRDERLAARRAGRSRRQSRDDVNNILAYLYFDGDDIVCDEREHGEISRISPDPDGRYIINGWAWTWQAVDPAFCDRIVGQIPPYGRQQAYEVLPHTGLRVPNNLIDIAPLDHRRRGLLFSAELRVDGMPVALVDRAQNGETILRPHRPDVFTVDDWREFVGECRYRGQAMSECEVLEALLDEAITGDIIADAELTYRRGGTGRRPTVYRLLDGEHRPLVTYADTPLPAQRDGWADLALQLSAHEAERYPDLEVFRWRFWKGDGWHYLADIAASTLRQHDPKRRPLPATITAEHWPVCSAVRVGDADSSEYIVIADRGSQYAPARYTTVRLLLERYGAYIRDGVHDLTWEQAQLSMIQRALLVPARHVEVLVYAKEPHSRNTQAIFVDGRPLQATDQITVRTEVFNLDSDLRHEDYDNELVWAHQVRDQQRLLSDAAAAHAHETLTVFAEDAALIYPPPPVTDPHA
jgi:hypothetical protein